MHACSDVAGGVVPWNFVGSSFRLCRQDYSFNSFGVIITYCQNISIAISGSGHRPNKITANVIPWTLHSYWVKLCSYCGHLSVFILANITVADLHNILSVIKLIELVQLTIYTPQHTSCSTSLTTLGHMNLSVIHEIVRFTTMWPEVGSVWHAFKILRLSFML